MMIYIMRPKSQISRLLATDFFVFVSCVVSDIQHLFLCCCSVFFYFSRAHDLLISYYKSLHLCFQVCPSSDCILYKYFFSLILSGIYHFINLLCPIGYFVRLWRICCLVRRPSSISRRILANHIRYWCVHFVTRRR